MTRKSYVCSIQNDLIYIHFIYLCWVWNYGKCFHVVHEIFDPPNRGYRKSVVDYALQHRSNVVVKLHNVVVAHVVRERKLLVFL